MELKKCLDNALRPMLLFWELSCSGPRVGLNDPCESPLTQDSVISDSAFMAFCNCSHLFSPFASLLVSCYSMTHSENYHKTKFKYIFRKHR